MKLKDYAIYDTKDNLLFVGKARECAEYLGLKNIQTFYDRCKYCRDNNVKCRKQLIVEIEDDEGGNDE